MHSFEPIDLGTYRGDDYFLMGFVEPEPSEGEDYDPDEDAENYGVTLVQEGTHPLEEHIEIVRMDTAHGQPHMDLVYLPRERWHSAKGSSPSPATPSQANVGA